ncbi:TonB-dependent receptor plug domain-containing protein [Alterisphingorhabdus coralli]|uniref:TonB-dependent receptor n=1 Tax=Alterisphingorhabdus coralli TaxID=3071408 RepID=A0AA97FAY6_9SPHN|nr:TonB-dependent receptor [Parasphingorhabdus sp. SCSIO 66989]WOE75745.1 TonB-dependent receptor [Parasphingorhabdus sp. SCSIO 66989]
MKKEDFAQQLKMGAAPLVLGLALIAAPASAQDQTPDDVQGAEDEFADDDPIVVTGTLIQNPSIESSSPVGVITSEELDLRQTNLAEDFLRELPASVPGIGSAVNNGNGGASFVNLRGLGAQRNLVLLDGKRFVPADFSGQVDLNSIPLAVLERTDILTGGATTTYGADAVSGVVNFVTRRDYAGLDINVSNRITEQGDGNIFRADVTMGANFDDGRGNAVLSVGYQSADEVLQGDRDFSVFNISSFSGNPGGSSNAVPATVTGPGTGGLRQLTPDGQALGPFDRPFNFNPFNIFQTPFERFNIFGSARYEISDNAEVYTQGTFSRQTVSTIIAPGGSFFNTYRLNLNNPFIPTAVANTFCQGLGPAGADGNPTALTDAQCQAGINTQFGATLPDGSANPDYREFDVGIRRRTVEAGTRNSDFTTTLFNIVAGVRGNITDSIRYDVSGTYGESERIQRQSGFARFERLQQSLLAIPGAGGPACIDPSGGCAPINLFGLQGDLGSQEAVDYVFNLTQQVANTSTVATINGTISGDFGGFAIADTPVAFAAGVEYREFTATRRSDEASQTPGAVVGGGGADPDLDGGYDVLDVFGELIVPLIEGQAFAEELILEAGVRFSDYSTAGTEWTWKLGASWTPVIGLTFRGNYQRAARAPNIGELFTPVTTGLDNLQIDPCQGAVTGVLLDTCLGQVEAGSPGALAIQNGLVEPPAAGQINVTQGGNANLGTEEAETWTVGAIFQPDFAPGLTVTLDYWNITVNDAITIPTVGDIIGACFDDPSPTNPSCSIANISRNPLTGGLDGAPDDTLGLIRPLTNNGTIQTDGFDLGINYGTDLTDNIALNLSFNGTWTLNSELQARDDLVNRECIGLFSVNCGSVASADGTSGSPQSEFAFNQRTSFIFDDSVTISLFWRFLSGLDYEPLQFERELATAQALGPDECPDPLGADGGSCIVDEDFRFIPDEHYFDLTLQWDATENLQFTFLVQNLFDNQPHVVGSNIGTTAFNSGNVYPSSYDPLGRRYTASARLRF